MPYLVLFVLIPISEIMVFINVSGKIGLGTALLMALFTAVIGGIIVKYQGMQTIMNAQNNLRHGSLPSKELFDGLCLVAAGATLITPGFITDALGFLLLIPAFRNMLRHKLAGSGQFETTQFGNGFPNMQEPQHHDDPTIIDAEYETIDDKESH